MPSFNRDALQKGSSAIEAAVTGRRGGGNFQPFLPNLFWKKDKDHRYILILNPVEEILQVELHPYIETENGPAMTMARTDQSIRASADPIQVRWGYKPRITDLAIAVELEPTVKVVDGREKPTGFEVKVRSFERRIRDDKGDLTEEREEVVAPNVGLIAQSPYNFFNQLASYDATEAPVHTTPFKITRLGDKGGEVSYVIRGYEGIDVDRTNLLEYIENVSYITDPEGLLEAIDGLDAVEASTLIGDYLLYRRVEELADETLYNEVLEGITKPSPWAEKDDKKATRKPRPSQRRRAATETSVEDTDKHAAQTQSIETVSKTSPAAERLEKLKARSRAVAKSSSD